MANWWEKIVKAEVSMSALLSSNGLLTPEYKRVDLIFSSYFNVTIPAYISKSFTNLEDCNGWYILELKRGENKWENENNHFFKVDSERFNEDSWLPIFDPLLTDIAKLELLNISYGGDCSSLVVVKKISKIISEDDHYEIRHFGFDYSIRGETFHFPSRKKDCDLKDIRINSRFLQDCLMVILSAEFGKKYYSNPKIKEELKNNLEKRFTKIILLKIQELSSVYL